MSWLLTAILSSALNLLKSLSSSSEVLTKLVKLSSVGMVTEKNFFVRPLFLMKLVWKYSNESFQMKYDTTIYDWIINSCPFI